MKKLYSTEEKHYHVSQWRASGQSMKSYSVSAGLCYQTFYSWAKSPTCFDAPPTPSFLPIGLASSTVSDKPRAELDLGNGLVLRVY